MINATVKIRKYATTGGTSRKMRVTAKTKRHKTSQCAVFRECQQIKTRVEQRGKGEKTLAMKR